MGVLVAGLSLLVLGAERVKEAASASEAGTATPHHDGPHPLTLLPLLSPQLHQKAVASEIFKGKKDNYPQSVPRLFINTRLGEILTFQ